MIFLMFFNTENSYLIFGVRFSFRFVKYCTFLWANRISKLVVSDGALNICTCLEIAGLWSNTDKCLKWKVLEKSIKTEQSEIGVESCRIFFSLTNFLWSRIHEWYIIIPNLSTGGLKFRLVAYQMNLVFLKRQFKIRTARHPLAWVEAQ